MRSWAIGATSRTSIGADGRRPSNPCSAARRWHLVASRSAVRLLFAPASPVAPSLQKKFRRALFSLAVRDLIGPVLDELSAVRDAYVPLLIGLLDGAGLPPAQPRRRSRTWRAASAIVRHFFAARLYAVGHLVGQGQANDPSVRAELLAWVWPSSAPGVRADLERFLHEMLALATGLHERRMRSTLDTMSAALGLNDGRKRPSHRPRDAVARGLYAMAVLEGLREGGAKALVEVTPAIATYLSGREGRAQISVASVERKIVEMRREMELNRDQKHGARGTWKAQPLIRALQPLLVPMLQPPLVPQAPTTHTQKD